MDPCLKVQIANASDIKKAIPMGQLFLYVARLEGFIHYIHVVHPSGSFAVQNGNPAIWSTLFAGSHPNRRYKKTNP